MAKIRALLAVCILVCGLLLGSTSVSAAEIKAPGLSASGTSVRTGQEIEFVFSLDGYEEIETGIHTVKGTLTYDPDIFETPSQADFTPVSPWESVHYNPENGQFSLFRRTGGLEGEDVLFVRLTARETLPAGDTYVGISDVSVSEGKEDIFPADAAAELMAISGQPSAGSQADTDNQAPSEGQTEQQPVIETGDAFPAMAVWLLCAGAAVLAAGCLIIARRGKKNAGSLRILAGLILTGAVAAAAAGSVYAFGGKGDLNGDGAVDYADVYILQKHLVALESLSENKQNRADMNADGTLSVTDLCLLIQKIEKTVDYAVSITPALENFYYEKQAEVPFRFYAAVSHGGEIQGVTINGRDYAVQKAEDGAYTARLQAAEAAGVQELRITKVSLRNGQDVEVSCTEKIEVRKAVPSLENFRAEEKADTAQMQVSFLLEDPDGAVTSSDMEVLKNADGEFIKVETLEVSAGENTFLLDLEEDTAYTLHISARYNRDSDTLEADADNSGSFAAMKEVRLHVDYQFTFGGLTAQTEAGAPAGKFSKNQPVVLWFTSNNATGFAPVQAVVNGETYPVEPAGDGYTVTLPGFTQTGEAEIRVEQVILENGKAFSPEKDNVKTLIILKERPAVTDLTAREEAEKGQFHIAFRLTDPDGTLQNRKISIRNADGKEVGAYAFSENELQDGVFSGSVPLTDKGLTSSYTVQIVADVRLSADGTEAENQKVLAALSVDAQPQAQVIAGKAGDAYVEKGGSLPLFYEVAHNVEAALAKLVVNHIELPVTAGPDGTWQVTATAPDAAGKQNFTLYQLVFADGTILDVNHILSVEVLKGAPTVQDYEAEDILEKEQVRFRFTLTDTDGAFLSGRVQLLSREKDTIVAEEAITGTGPQVFTLDVEEQKAYTFRVLLSYTETEDGSRQVRDAVALEKTVYLMRDYGLRLSDMQTSGADGTDTVYFEPGSTLQLRFRAETRASLAVQQVQMNGKMYSLTPLEDKVYTLTAEAGSLPGVQVLTIEKVVLENGKELTAEAGHSIRVEVLKAAPRVENFTWEKTVQDELRVQFTLQDPDGALQDARLEIAEAGGRVLLRESIAAGDKQATVKLTEAEQYTLRVTADFDRDTNTLDQQSNAYTDEEIYGDTLAASRDAIQFKDVTGTRLYKNTASGPKEVEVLDITGGLPADAESYYAVIQMENLPDFYAGIREFRRDGDTGRVYAVIEQDDVIRYDADGSRQQGYAFPLAYRDAEGEHPLMQSAEELFRQMAASPGGRYELTEDLDASGLSAAAAAVAGTFTGELDGNGYKIVNLPTSLFDRLSGAYIHDLVIENARITASRSGILANVIQNQSTVEKVFITHSSISNGVDGLGVFAGSLNHSTIRQSASIDVSIKGLVAVGGIVGKTGAGAVIENCYVTGKVQGTYDHPSLGARVGGIAGWHGGGVIRACYTQVQVVAPAKKGNGGLIGGPNTGSPVIEDSLSMSSGAGYRIAGFDVLDSAKNVYEYAGSDSATNITEDNREQIKETDAIFDRNFYRDTLGWDEAVWELELLAYGKRPSLQGAPVADNNYQIPAYTQVLADPGYTPAREQAYANMAKLMPFSDVRTLVAYGNRLSDTDALVTEALQFVLPLDADGALVTGITRDEAGRIAKIRLVFQEGNMQEYALSWQKAMGNVVAAYTAHNADLLYQFHRYMADPEDGLLDAALGLVSALDYAADIAALTGEEESRLYTDYYNESVKPRLREVVEGILYSQADYPTYCKNEVVQQLVRERIGDAETWKRLLYGYNYYDKWYHIDFQGVNLSDLIFQNGELLARDMTAAALTEKLLSAPAEQRQTNRTVVFYNNVLQNYTGEPLMDFLGGLARRMAGYADASDWFVDTFDGILKEQAAQGGAEGLRYRIWDILTGLNDGQKSVVLPILTAPQEDMYLISLPSQLMLGSLNRYPEYLNKDGNERQRMRDIIDAYAEKMGNFYGVSSTWMGNAASQLNSFVNIQFDTRLNFPASAAADAGDQDKGTTREPVMKWVFEANDTISIKNGSAAVANGTNVFWVLTPALGTSDYIFFTFSHETAHNQDGRYFYGGAGRRNGTGAEAHADGNIAQEMRDGCMVFNISKINDTGLEMTGNFSYERIDSAEKIHSYYREMFETGYVLDYLAAQAFLRLPAEQQAAVAVQAHHTAGGNASFTTEYRDVTVEEIRQMQLQDVEDLWENRLSIRNQKKGAAEKINTATDGSYGFEAFYCMNWYQSHNNDGSPDTHAFKRLGMEMLGVGGFEGGYQIYMSARSENDLDALRKITGDPRITWKDYKLGRFQRVKENLDKIPYFDPEAVIQQFMEAFQRDAQKGTRSESTAVKRMLYGIVKRATGDFSEGGIYQSPAIIQVTSAEEFIRLAAENPYGSFRLEADLDFTGIAAAGGSYISGRFMGILDGNGHKITGMRYPLFGDLQYALIKDLTIADPAYDTGVAALLAVKSRQVILGHVAVTGLSSTDAARGLSLVKTRTDVYYEYGNTGVQTGADNSVSTTG